MSAKQSYDIPVKCCRCRNRHMESQRIAGARNGIMTQKVCPRCRCKSYYDMRQMAAWCFASGIIEFGDQEEMPDGAILIAAGPKAFLPGIIEVLARHGYKDNVLLVPGVPEAETQQAKGDALASWLSWCACGNGSKHRDGVVFAEVMA